MNFLGIEIANSTIQEGIVYLLDPDNRIFLIGVAIVMLFFVIKRIFRSFKILLLIAAVIVVLYFGLQFLTNAA